MTTLAARGRRFILRHLPLPLLRESMGMFVASQGVLVAVAYLVGLGAPRALATILPDWMMTVWAWQLLLGCGATLFGLARAWPKVEVAGLRLMAPCQVVYAIVIMSYARWDGLGGALPQLLFGVAAAGRALWLTEYLRAVADGRDGGGPTKAA